MVRVQAAALSTVLSLASFSLAATEKLLVYTVNYPLLYFAQRIGGSHVDVRFPAPADVDPAFWEPDAKMVAEYQQADLILLNGANYAKWVSRVSLQRLRSVDTALGFRDQLIKVSPSTTHSHGPGGDHSHSGTAFTTWLDPLLASRQAQAIRDALIRQRPGLANGFSENYAALNGELLELDKTIAQVISSQPGQPLLASHPVYQYFARRYKLDLQNVLWEPDVEPGEEDWSVLRNLAGQHPARWMIWEGVPLQKVSERLNGMGIQSVVWQTCANKPAKGDFMRVMAENIYNLSAAFSDD